MRTLQLVLSATLGAALLAGCGGPLVPASGQATPPSPDFAAAPAELAPAVIDVPSIGAHSTLDPLGVDPTTGEVIGPDVHHPKQAGWIKVANPGAPPARNPVVVLGHVDGDHQQGVFYRLRDIKSGAKINVVMSDGTQRVYTVTHTQEIKKAKFPTAAVYGPADSDQQIRLVTCGGTFDPVKRSYLNNVIAYGQLDQ